MSCLNFDAIAEHVKNIYDKTRCSTCDKHDGIRMRYQCGHTSCDDCVNVSESCVLCLTPPETTSRKPVIDDPLTLRAKNISNVVNILKKQFNLDVERRQRLSEQLKVEKAVFPKCIQAPSKYFNKRKSFKISNSKENYPPSFLGEETSAVLEINNKMENSNENVSQWIKKYIRKPFSELNPNDNSLNKSSFSIRRGLENLNSKDSNRKRPYEENPKKSIKAINKVKKLKKVKESMVIINNDIIEDTQRVLNDESGIVLDGHDDEAVIVINDSAPVVDKDLNAWLAVQEAEKNRNSTSILEFSAESPKLTYNLNNNTKIPFYKKGHLRDPCTLCNDFQILNDFEKPKEFQIIVENQSFLTTIKVSRVDNVIEKQTNVLGQSIAVQTNDNNNHDDSGIDQATTNHNISQSFSDDLFLNDEQIIKNINGENKESCKTHVIIEESDTDEDFEPSLSLEVTADVHRSCDQLDYGILAHVNDVTAHGKRPRRAARGLTPTSTDSSDKENYNPNRMKTKTHSKKKHKK